MNKRTSARRTASFLAVLGVLVMSSGVALMAAASPATAGGEIHKSYVCKYVGTPGSGELAQTGRNPIWVDNHSIAGKDVVSVGDTFSDAQGYSVVIIANTAKLKPEPSVSACTGGSEEPPPGDASASATPVQPTCAEPVPSYTTTASHATFTSKPAAVAGTTIHVVAEADDHFAFGNGDTTLDIPLTFNAAPTDCGVVNAPLQATASAVPVSPTCASNVASYTTTGSVGVAGFTQSAAPAFGTTITVTATAAPNYAFGDAPTKAIQVTFGAAATGCSSVVSPPTTTSVSPPTTAVKTQTKAKAKTQVESAAVTPTVVHAGLTSVSAQDMRGEQGLALMFAGMLMLMAASGLGLRLRGSATRS